MLTARCGSSSSSTTVVTQWVDDEVEGRLLHDLRTDFYYPESLVVEMATRMADLPAYAAPEAPDVGAYLAERRTAIDDMLAHGVPKYPYADPSGDTLERLAGESLGFAAVSIDLVGSTRLQATNIDAYNIIVPILLHEISVATAIFGGLVIKYAGEGHGYRCRLR